MSEATRPELHLCPAAGRPPGEVGTRPAGPGGAPALAPTTATGGDSPAEESHAGSLALLASWG